MEVEPVWIAKAFDFLVPGAAGIFIWATTIANFLEQDPEGQFAMLERGGGKRLKSLDSLYFLYSTIVKTSWSQKERNQGSCLHYRYNGFFQGTA